MRLLCHSLGCSLESGHWSRGQHQD